MLKKKKKRQDHANHASNRQTGSLMPAVFSSYLIMTRGKFPSIAGLRDKNLTSRPPHFVVNRFWVIIQDDSWFVFPHAPQGKKTSKSSKMSCIRAGLSAFKMLCIRVLRGNSFEKTAIKCFWGRARERKDPRGASWPIQLLREAVWWMASTGDNGQPWGTGLCSRVLAPSPLTCPTDLCACTHGRDAPALCKLRPSTIVYAKGPLPAAAPPQPPTSTQFGQMVTELKVESWTMEDEAANLQIHCRISTNQLHGKTKNWWMGWALFFSRRGQWVSNHTQVVTSGRINLCSQGYFPVQSRKRALDRIWWNSVYSSIAVHFWSALWVWRAGLSRWCYSMPHPFWPQGPCP